MWATITTTSKYPFILLFFYLLHYYYYCVFFSNHCLLFLFIVCLWIIKLKASRVIWQTHHPIYRCISLCPSPRSLNRNFFSSTHKLFLFRIVLMAATSSSQLKNICVLSGFRYGKYKEFVQAAIDLGRAIAKRKLHLVYGGGDRGLSKLIS